MVAVVQGVRKLTLKHWTLSALYSQVDAFIILFCHSQVRMAETFSKKA